MRFQPQSAPHVLMSALTFVLAALTLSAVAQVPGARIQPTCASLTPTSVNTPTINSWPSGVNPNNGYHGRLDFCSQAIDVNDDGNLDVVWAAHTDALQGGPYFNPLRGMYAAAYTGLGTVQNPIITITSSIGFTDAFGQQLLARDVNGDGRLDLLPAFMGDPSPSPTPLSLQWYEKTAPSTFVARPFAQLPPYAAGWGGGAIDYGDLTGDGVPDYVVSAISVAAVMYPGTGAPNGTNAVYFGPMVTLVPLFGTGYPMGGTLWGATSVCIGDLNGDGRPDLAMNMPVQGHPNNYLLIIFNSPSGLLTTPAATASFSLLVNNWMTPLRLVDCDRDGDLDAIYGGMRMMLNSGNGLAWASVAVGLYSEAVNLVADINGDGLADYNTFFGSQQLAFIWGRLRSCTHADIAVDNKYIAVSASATITCPPAGPPEPGMIRLLDFTGDGALDVAVSGSHGAACGGSNSERMIVNMPGGLYDSATGTAQLLSLSGGRTLGGPLVMLDANADGLMDVAFAYNGVGLDGTGIALGLNPSSGLQGKLLATPTPPVTRTALPVLLLVAADVSLDGRTDLVYALGGLNDTILVSLNAGYPWTNYAAGGGFEAAVAVGALGAGAAASNVSWLACADMTGDAVPDIVYAVGAGAPAVAGSVVLLANVAPYTGRLWAAPLVLAAPGTLSGSVSAALLSLADLDGDGWLELVVGEPALSVVFYLRRERPISAASLFNSTRTDVTTGAAGLMRIRTGDFVGRDGVPDIAIARATAGTATLYLQQITAGGAAAGAAASVTSIGPTANAVNFLAGLDMDGDNDTDVLLLGSAQLRWHENRDVNGTVWAASGKHTPTWTWNMLSGAPAAAATEVVSASFIANGEQSPAVWAAGGTTVTTILPANNWHGDAARPRNYFVDVGRCGYTVACIAEAVAQASVCTLMVTNVYIPPGRYVGCFKASLFELNRRVVLRTWIGNTLHGARAAPASNDMAEAAARVLIDCERGGGGGLFLTSIVAMLAGGAGIVGPMEFRGATIPSARAAQDLLSSGPMVVTGALTMTDVAFVRCSSRAAAVNAELFAVPSYGYGGALVVNARGLLTVTNSRFTACTADNSGGAIAVLDTDGSSRIVLSGVAFDSNVALVGSGGGLLVRSTASVSAPLVVRMSAVNFTSNVAIVGAGGGARIVGAALDVVAASPSFVSNVAGLGGGGLSIETIGTRVVALADARFVANTAPVGGAIGLLALGLSGAGAAPSGYPSQASSAYVPDGLGLADAWGGATGAAPPAVTLSGSMVIAGNRATYGAVAFVSDLIVAFNASVVSGYGNVASTAGGAVFTSLPPLLPPGTPPPPPASIPWSALSPATTAAFASTAFADAAVYGPLRASPVALARFVVALPPVVDSMATVDSGSIALSDLFGQNIRDPVLAVTVRQSPNAPARNVTLLNAVIGAGGAVTPAELASAPIALDDLMVGALDVGTLTLSVRLRLSVAALSTRANSTLETLVSFDACAPGSGIMASTSGVGLTCGLCPAFTFSSAPGIAACASCGASAVDMGIGRTSCITCPKATVPAAAGRYTLVNVTVRPIPAAALDGVFCECIEGYYSPQGLGTECLACILSGVCPGGVAQPICERLTETRRDAATGIMSCVRCPDSSLDVGPGASECVACPANSALAPTGQYSLANVTVTPVPAAAAAGYFCYCPEGFYAPHGSIGEPCAMCPRGATCGGGLAVPLAQSGYYGSGSNFNVCKRPGACAGGSARCSAGYEGYMCAHCSKGYYTAADRRCRPCPTISAQFFALFILAVVSAATVLTLGAFYGIRGVLHRLEAAPAGTEAHELFIRKLRRMMPLTPHSVSMGVVFLQIVSLIGELNVSWPSSVRTVFAQLSALNLGIEVFATECAVESFEVRFLSSVLYPLGGLATVVIVAGIAAARLPAVIGGITRGRVFSTILDRVVALAGPLLYISLARASLMLFDCTQLPNGEYRLDADMGRKCFDARWRRLLPVAVAANVVYTLGIPLLLFGRLASYARAHRLMETETMQRLGPLYRPYRARYWWAEAASMAKRLLMVVFSLFLTDTPIAQIFLFVLVFAAFTLFSSSRRPYTAEPLNDLETRLNAAGALICLFAAAFYADSLADGSVRSAFIGVVFLVFAYACLCMGLAAAREVALRQRVNRRLEEEAQAGAGGGSGSRDDADAAAGGMLSAVKQHGANEAVRRLLRNMAKDADDYDSPAFVAGVLALAENEFVGVDASVDVASGGRDRRRVGPAPESAEQPSPRQDSTLTATPPSSGVALAASAPVVSSGNVRRMTTTAAGTVRPAAAPAVPAASAGVQAGGVAPPMTAGTGGRAATSSGGGASRGRRQSGSARSTSGPPSVGPDIELGTLKE